MKKKLLALAMAVCTLFSAVPTLAKDTDDIAKLYEKHHYCQNEVYGYACPEYDSLTIDIVYNQEVVTKTVAVKKEDDTTMVDIKALCELIGAEAQFSRTNMNAVRGDITVDVEGKTVTVKNKDKTNSFEMTQNPVVVDDIVYYPVRSIASAFDITIDWSNSIKVVTLVDMYAYMQAFEKDAPNMYAMLSEKMVMPNIQNDIFSIKFDLEIPEAPKLNAKLDMVADTLVKDEIISSAMKFDLNLKDIADYIANMADEDTLTWIPDLKDVTVDVMMDGSVLYLKTNLLEKLTESKDAPKELKLIANIVDENKWVKLDLEEFAKEYMYLDDEYIQTIKNALSGEMTGIEYLQNMFSSMSSMEYGMPPMLIDYQFEIFTKMDKYIVYTKDEKDGYTVAMKMNIDDIIDIVKDFAGGIPEDEIKNIKKMLNFDLDLTSKVTKDNGESKANIEFGMTSDEFKFNILMDMKSKFENNKEVKVPEVPKRAIDLMVLREMSDWRWF